MAIEKVYYKQLFTVPPLNGAREFVMNVTYPVENPPTPLTQEEFQSQLEWLKTPPVAPRTFVIGAFTALFDPGLRRLPDWYKVFVESFHLFYEGVGFESYSCFRREHYGLKGITSEQATVLDKLALDTSHFLTLLPGASNSQGTWKELDYATRAGTEVVCFFKGKDPEIEFQLAIKGLAAENGAKSPLTIVTYENSDDLFAQLGAVIPELRGKYNGLNNHPIIAQ